MSEISPQLKPKHFDNPEGPFVIDVVFDSTNSALSFTYYVPPTPEQESTDDDGQRTLRYTVSIPASDAAGNVALPKTVRLYPPTANPWKKSDQIELYFENTSGDSLGSGTASLSNAENTGQRGDPFQ